MSLWSTHVCTCTCTHKFSCFVKAICNDEKYEYWKGKLENMPMERRKELLTAQDEDGWTPLHHAARYYRTAVLGSAVGLDGDGNYCSSVGLFTRLVRSWPQV